MRSYTTLPEGLPIPKDDGACDHLLNKALPDIDLMTTDDEEVNLSRLKGWCVLYCYPMTGRPGTALPKGWDQIPGARGCTPQSCAFRDHHAVITGLGAQVFGISTQSTVYQQEMVARLHLPYPVVSDYDLKLSQALQIPLFAVEGNILMKRVTLMILDGIIQAVHYPVFPSDQDPDWVIAYLRHHAGLKAESATDI